MCLCVTWDRGHGGNVNVGEGKRGDGREVCWEGRKEGGFCGWSEWVGGWMNGWRESQRFG